MSGQQKQRIFVSHASVDKKFAISLKELIEFAYANVAHVFVSSGDLSPGDYWRDVIKGHLQTAELYLAVFSSRSLRRPWLLFEMGAAEGRGCRIIPLLIKGVEPRNLFSPLDALQAQTWHPTRSDAKKLIEQVGDHFSWSYPASSPKLNKLMDQVVKLAEAVDFQLPPPLTQSALAVEPRLVGQMRSDILDLSPNRGIFFGAVDELYGREFSNRNGFPADVRDLIAASSPPPNLPIPPGSDLCDWVNSLSLEVNGASAKLLDFCKAVYGEKTTGHASKAECSQVSPLLFDQFDQARGKHAHLFNRWAENVYDSQTVSLESVIAEFKGYRDMVMLLSYLEPCLATSTLGKGSGKHWLFLLNRHWSEIGNRVE